MCFREVLADREPVRVAGAHDAMGAVLAQEAGFDAVWASSFEISAARCLPDASILTMTEYLTAAASMQKVLGIPVVADCDTGFGSAMNVAHMVHEYEGAGISAVCIEDKLFPKMNSFVSTHHALLDVGEFAKKIDVAKRSCSDPGFFVIARTEALISGGTVHDALARCRAYAEAGADAVLVHSKARSNEQILEFLEQWDKRLPVVIVPTTYPDWHVDEAAKQGVSVVIYANQGLRATVRALRETYLEIRRSGTSVPVEDRVASLEEVFKIQRLRDWQHLEG
jgi:phosphoenolpyruvate phosphomutase